MKSVLEGTKGIVIYPNEAGRFLGKSSFLPLSIRFRKGGVMHDAYQRHLDQGMPKIKALVAIARKLLGVVFALVRDHNEYMENYSKGATLKLAA